MAPITIVARAHRPSGLAADEAYLYFTTADDAVLRTPKRGGAIEALAENEDSPSAIAVDGDRVYWVDARALRATVKSGSGVVVDLFSDGALSPVIAADGANLYCAVTELGEILQIPKSGGPRKQIVGEQQFGLGILGLAVDGSAVYFTNHFSASVVVAPFVGSPRIIASAQPAPYALAVRDGGVFWSRNNHPGVVMRASADGWLGPVADDQSFPWGIATDESSVYWLDVGDGSVWRARLDGSGTTKIAQSHGYPVSIVVDEDAVYWTDRTSDAIMSVPK